MEWPETIVSVVHPPRLVGQRNQAATNATASQAAVGSTPRSRRGSPAPAPSGVAPPTSSTSCMTCVRSVLPASVGDDDRDLHHGVRGEAGGRGREGRGVAGGGGPGDLAERHVARAEERDLDGLVVA